MVINFSKINSDDKGNTPLHPRDIFSALLRDVQTQVWNNWFLRRNEKDLIIKMNTGSGKTTVGLLILKSCLNEDNSPDYENLIEQQLSKHKLIANDFCVTHSLKYIAQ